MWQEDIRTLPESSIKSGGFVIDTLDAAFWCFLTTDSYRDAVLKAVNLGDDTDTTAAITGALAGLVYGLEGIPTEWLETLAASGHSVQFLFYMTAHRSTGIRLTSLRSSIGRSLLTYTVGLALKRQRREARSDPPSYCPGHTGAVNPLAGGKVNLKPRVICPKKGA
ncbi:MAG: ADP-ribosylglycohydrolase family protein [Treponema sp.]|nr:ADP-ribosylglycohydrolase family protein [Treponema sp.]